MSRVVIETKGLDKLISDMSGYTADLTKKISMGMNANGNSVQKEARSNHRFKSGDGNSGNLDRAVTFVQSRKGTTNIAEFYLNDAITTTKNGKSYGVFIHEGTYQGYDQSPIAPKYSNKTSKSGSGWKADPFLYNAIRKEWKIDKTLNTIQVDLKKKYERK